MGVDNPGLLTCWNSCMSMSTARRQHVCVCELTTMMERATTQCPMRRRGISWSPMKGFEWQVPLFCRGKYNTYRKYKDKDYRVGWNYRDTTDTTTTRGRPKRHTPKGAGCVPWLQVASMSCAGHHPPSPCETPTPCPGPCV